jgi:hypothetical protein
LHLSKSLLVVEEVLPYLQSHLYPEQEHRDLPARQHRLVHRE